MKLVELLARELKVWPYHLGAMAISQDPDGSLNRLDRGLGVDDACLASIGGTWPSNTWTRFSLMTPTSTATDHATAIVTIADWEAEVARLAKPEWIRHRGGKCPIEAGFLIDVRHRDGCIGTRCNPFSGKWDWRHSGHETDIMAYRICEPEQAPQKAWHSTAPLSDEERAHAFEADIEFPSGVIHFAGPIQWRDRIREIDITVEALEEERAGLVQQLEDEGFRLISAVNAKIAAVAQAHEDMSDWRNWMDGDLVECISHEIEWSDKTDIGSICKIDGSPLFDENGLHIFVAGYFMNPADFRWHSRPSV
ncbi:MAG TPA: hypothetical protein V6D20_10760, partial [Candidatus Obscuribacterales bacterium]